MKLLLWAFSLLDHFLSGFVCVFSSHSFSFSLFPRFLLSHRFWCLCRLFSFASADQCAERRLPALAKRAHACPTWRRKVAAGTTAACRPRFSACHAAAVFQTPYVSLTGAAAYWLTLSYMYLLHAVVVSHGLRGVFGGE